MVNISIIIKDIFYAYRKAKADCFFDRTIGSPKKFADFERELEKNLQENCSKLNLDQIDINSFTVSQELINFYLPEHSNCIMIVPKKITFKDKKSIEPHIDQNEQFKIRLHNNGEIIPEYRVIGNFEVNFHILSALWINKVGVKYDAALSEHVYGSRLRRYRGNEINGQKSIGDYQINGLGSFFPYFTYYKKWRETGFEVIKDQLKKDRSLIIMSMDIANFYHRIDPNFILNDCYLKDAKISLTEEEKILTKILLAVLNKWAEIAKNEIQSFADPQNIPKTLWGIPIGLSASRVISNALLISLDRTILNELSPLYYGRYVDDLSLVLSNPGNLYDRNSIINYVLKRVNLNTKNFISINTKKPIKVNLNKYTGCNSVIELNPTKLKIYALTGISGLHMLEHIEAEIKAVSSERRLMLSPADLKKMTATKVITASNKDGQNIDSLRRVDGLTIKKLGFSVLFRTVETIAHDVNLNDWKSELDDFYKLGYNYLFTPISIYENSANLLRYLSLAVKSKDWDNVNKLIELSMQSTDNVYSLFEKNSSKSIKVNGYEVNLNDEPNKVFEKLKDTIEQQIKEIVLRSVKLKWSSQTYNFEIEALNNIQSLKIFKDFQSSNSSAILSDRILKLYLADFGCDPLQEILLDRHKISFTIEENNEIFNSYEYIKTIKHLTGFFNKFSKGLEDKSKINFEMPFFLFPTRPLKPNLILKLMLPNNYWSPQESSKDEPDNRDQLNLSLSEYVQAIRGVWTNNNVNFDNSIKNLTTVEILKNIKFESGQNDEVDKQNGANEGIIYLGVSSLLTKDHEWRAAAKLESIHSQDRYNRIKTIVNAAINSNPKPDYLLLPELSLPNKWIDTVANRLIDQKISLIAGIEYSPINENIYSSAYLSLYNDAIGYFTRLDFSQKKSLPAPNEEFELIHKMGKKWASNSQIYDLNKKYIFTHLGFTFGLLICSELSDMNNRQLFQGKVDCLIILSWNKDLNSFATLVDSACLDIHSFVTIVNNRQFGESRVRSPAKESYKRELCTIRGGENEQLVIVKIDFKQLREFQSRAKNWPNENDSFKPVPQGFIISEDRKVIPK